MQVDNKTTLASRPVKEIYAVSRLVREARGVLEGSFPLLWVEGEISNLAMPASGHIYFTLKDAAAQVRCAMFKMRNRQLRFTPKNGMQVLLRVRVTLYEGRGEFQCVVEHMEEAGSGALQRAFEALKYRLGEEGLFDQAHKKELPKYPASIGIVSSSSGAAVHDILTVLNRRFSTANVILYPVAVQGGDSAKQIADAIKLAESREECEVLIISRGGGSLEDLWSFNDEQVARAIFTCQIPIISAVGHEVDFTIADFVADVRAPTPSVAAELAVPDAAELWSRISQYSRRLSVLMSHRLQNEQQHIQYLQQHLPQPQSMISQQMQRVDRLDQQLKRIWTQIINHKRQRLDYWSVQLKHPQAKIDIQQHHVAHLGERLQQQLKQKVAAKQYQLQTLLQRLQVVSPITTIKKQQQRVVQYNNVLQAFMQQRLQTQKARLAIQLRTLAAVSPLNTLERGYSITTLADNGEVVTDAIAVECGQSVNIRLQRGLLRCDITEVKND